MQGTVTISLSEYESLKNLEKAIKKRKNVRLNSYPYDCYLIEDSTTEILLNRIIELDQMNSQLLTENIKLQYTKKSWF